MSLNETLLASIKLQGLIIPTAWIRTLAVKRSGLHKRLICLSLQFVSQDGRKEQMDSFLALHPVALDSILGIPENFSIDVAEIY